jgi:hypothetical protein
MSHKGLHIMENLRYTSHLLQCQYQATTRNKLTIYVCETGTQDIYARCMYRGAYAGFTDLVSAWDASTLTIYIESARQALYNRAEEAIIQVACDMSAYRIHIAPAKVSQRLGPGKQNFSDSCAHQLHSHMKWRRVLCLGGRTEAAKHVLSTW